MRAVELFEMHYSDLFPRSFGIFYAKYSPLVNDTSLYVNFTDVVGDPINKNFSPRPNHRDPTGLYTYPLDYIIKHPSEIEYGQQARFLRVIRDTSRRKLILNSLTHDQAIALLTRMGVTEPAKKMAFLQRRYNYVGGDLVAKQFFGVLQTYLEVGQQTVTPNRQQTALLLKAGIDAIEDRSGNSFDAIIFHAEPEQCVFLTRSAFQVIDVYELRSEQSHNINHADPRELLRRLPGLIAQAIGDRIVANNLTAERGERMSFYTAAKRKIVVMMTKQYRFLVGHRQGNIYSGDEINVTVMGPDFKPISQTYPVQATFVDIAADIAARFAEREPDEGQSYDLFSEYGPDIKETNELLAMVAAKLRVPFTPAPDEATAFRIFVTVKAINVKFSFHYANNRENLVAFLAQAVQRLWPKPRYPQGREILQIWKAAAARRQITISDLHHLPKIANKLGLVGYSGLPKKGENYERRYGDLTIFRRGDALMVQIGEHEEQIAKIDNLTLEDWQKPHGDGYNYRLMLPYAAQLADYLNDNKFVVTGYYTFLPQFYGISFVNNHWYPTEKVSEKLDTFGPVTIWMLPAGQHRDRPVVASMDGETDNSDLGAVPNEYWRSQIDLFSLDGNEVTNIGHLVGEYLQREQHRKDNPNSFSGQNYVTDYYLESGYGGHAEKRPGSVTWKAMEDAGFNLLDYIRKKGYTLSPKLGDEITLFGMVLNHDNNKIGKTWADVLKPIGKFNGLAMYSVKTRTTHWQSMHRYFVFHENGKIISAVTCEPDAYTGKHVTKISWIADNLTKAQRLAVRELLASLSLTVPRKFASTLTVGRSHKSANAESTKGA